NKAATDYFQTFVARGRSVTQIGFRLAHDGVDGFVNIKGQMSDDRPGFNPYRKIAPDSNDKGDAFKNAKEKVDFDLDMQIIEYAASATNWSHATDSASVLQNGDMESGDLSPASQTNAWKPFSIDPATAHSFVLDGKEKTGRFARVLGGGKSGKPIDGGFVERVEGLSHFETYRLSGRAR
ncbi:MAG TPA: hypothetical protein VGK40_08245, partial [Verrucomicrobiae bacterium]